jgi:hypothetical protein
MRGWLALGDSSKSITGKWKALLIKSFLVGLTVTAVAFFLLKDVEEGFSQVYIKLTVQTLASCILGGVIVGLILPVVSFRAVGLHASFSTVVGAVIYLLIYRLVIPPLLPNLYFDIVSNFAGSFIGGLVGGIAGNEAKRLIKLI